MRPGSRLLGLDVGAKTVGIAVSDGRLGSATPVETIRRKKLKDDVAALNRLIADRDVGGLIVGLPMNMDGSEGRAANRSGSSLRTSRPLSTCPFAFWDERFSTVAVEAHADRQDVSRRRRDAVIDAHAAAFILQGALDRLQVLAKED